MTTVEPDLLKIGDRVDVKMIVTESWESEAGMSNGILKGIRTFNGFKSYWISSDEHSSKIDYHRQLHGGHYSDCKYLISKTKKNKNGK